VVAGLLSDGVLAWRFYALYDRKRWTLFIPGALLAATLGEGIYTASKIISEDQWIDDASLGKVYFISTNPAWAWLMLATNTVLTVLILARLVYRASYSKRLFSKGNLRNLFRHRHIVAVEAVIESALVSWVGLLVLAITAGISFHSDIDDDSNDWAYTSYIILPYLFGISQCLITVRLGFARQAGKFAAALQRGPSLLDRNGGPILIPPSQWETTNHEHEASVLATMTPFVLGLTSVPENIPLDDYDSKDSVQVEAGSPRRSTP